MKSRGFTLIELLVAIFISAIIFTMGYGAINQALAQRGGIEDQQERLLAVQTAIRLLAQDLGQAAPRPVREPVGDGWQPAFATQGSGSSQGQSGQMLFALTRAGWANPAGIQRPALQRVSYVFEDNTLRREHWPVLDATLANKPIRRDLLSDVKSVTVRYMDPGRRWIEQWPVQNIDSRIPASSFPQPQPYQRSRPLAVEITLELEDWGKVVRIFEIPQ
jgi:general secretion pathway protein J